MLGLGVGAFIGGCLVDRFNEQHVFVISLIELTIAVYLSTTLKEDYVGRSMSQIYAATIGSSAIGLLVNFGVMQLATTQLAFSLIAVLAIGTAIISLVRIT